MPEDNDQQFAQSPFDWRYHRLVPAHPRPPGVVQATCGHLMPQTVPTVREPRSGALLCEDGCLDPRKEATV